MVEAEDLPTFDDSEGIHNAAGQTCYEYKFQGAWPTASPTMSPTIAGAFVQTTNVIVSIQSEFQLDRDQPVIPRIECHDDLFLAALNASYESIIESELQASLSLESISGEVVGPCAIVSAIDVKITALCLQQYCNDTDKNGKLFRINRILHLYFR